MSQSINTPLAILSELQAMERKLCTVPRHLSQRDMTKIHKLLVALYDHRLIVEINAHDVDRFERRIADVSDSLMIYRDAVWQSRHADQVGRFGPLLDLDRRAAEEKKHLRASLRRLRDECSSMFKEGTTV